MEDLEKYILEFKPAEDRPPLTDQSKLNKYLIESLSIMVHDKSGGTKKFLMAPDLKKTYSQIFRYLNNDYSLTNDIDHVSIQPWDLNKGIILIGNFGRGKTLLLDLIFKQRQKLKILGRYCTAYELSVMFNSDKKRFEDLTNAENCLFLDEIGDEPKETLNFGNSENVAYRAMKLFFDKVEKQKEKQRFFGTSNLGQAEIIERYDERIWSRIVGNCNIVVFGSGIKDFRK